MTFKFYVTHFINQPIAIFHFCFKNLQDNDEFIADVYLKSPVKPVMKFFFFNLTNPEEFLTGGTPIFNEVGPFAYK